MTKQISLTQGKFATVDDADFDHLNQWKWHFSHYGYARRTTSSRFGRQKFIFMHREIMQAPDGMDVDHINCNKLDNRRQNLRLCTRADNLRNRNKQSNNT